MNVACLTHEGFKPQFIFTLSELSVLVIAFIRTLTGAISTKEWFTSNAQSSQKLSRSVQCVKEVLEFYRSYASH